MSEFSPDLVAAGRVVEFRSPLGDRVKAAIKVAFLIAFYTFASAIVSVLILMGVWPVATPPMWAFMAAGSAVLVMPFVIVWLFNRFEPKRLILHDGRVWLGGFFGGRNIRYEHVDLLKEEEVPGLVPPEVKVTIRYGWRDSFIRLAHRDGIACFEALAGLCDGAATIALDESYAPPPNPARRERGRRQLMREFKRRGRETLAGALLLATLSLCALAATFVGTSAVVLIASQVLMIGGAAATGGTIWRYIKLRRIVCEIAALRVEDETELSHFLDG